jgi:hypothetical protein
LIVGRPLEGPFHGGGGWQPISAGYFDVFKIAVKRGPRVHGSRRRLGAAGGVINERWRSSSGQGSVHSASGSAGHARARNEPARDHRRGR